MENFKSYFKSKHITKMAASDQIGITRQTLYNILKDGKVSVSTAKKIEKWSNGELKAIDLLGLK